MNIKYLSQDELKDMLTMQMVIEQTEAVYQWKSEDQTVVWPTTFYEFDPGHADMDIKSGYLPGLHVFGHKTVSFMEANREKGLPDLVGLIVVFDSLTGFPIGIVDGAYITGMRTGAAGAIGAKYLARTDSKRVLIIGTGNQAPFQIAALLTVFPDLERIRIANPRHPKHAVKLVEEIVEKLHFEFQICARHVIFEAVTNLQEAVGDSDIIVTVTPSRTPLIQKSWVKPGTHFSCIGADATGKEEIDPTIFADARIYVDDFIHCVQAGEIELPIKQGVITEDHIIGEMGDLILQKVSGRTTESDITIFDATGMALLDLAVANAALKLLKIEII